MSEVKWRTAQHTECSSEMVLFDTNLVKCSIFSLLLSLKQSLHLSKFIQYNVRALHSCLQTIKKSRYSPAQMLESEECSSQKQLHQQHSLSLLFSGEMWKLGLGKRHPLHLRHTQRERERERDCCHGVELRFHKCFSKVMPCLINSKSSHSSTATQPAYSRCSPKPFHADL